MAAKAWHLERGEKEDEIYAPLRDETAEGKNGWYSACERLGLRVVFLNDVHRAWQMASTAQAIGLECHFAW